ncbi:MAG: ribonuclease R [Nitrospirae bacterium]|nr:ribonuclease R [Nitrospirota bacterium]
MVSKEALNQHFKSIRVPQSFQDLSKTLCKSNKETKTLKKLLRVLVSEGKIEITRNRLYSLSDGDNIVYGYFEANKGGYGFVITETPGESDIFIPQRKTMGTMNNDRVVAKVENQKRREGRIIKIVERAHAKVVGKLVLLDNSYYLLPKHKSIPFKILVPRNDLNRAVEGDTAIVEMKGYNPPTGKVLKTIAAPEDPRSEIEAIVEEYHLPRRFPKAVVADATELQSRMKTEGQIEGRVDLRALPTVTIDSETAKDFDDAVSVIKTNDGYKLYVHIADVSHFVTWDSAIDLEARQRGTSFYFPDRVIPMLPKTLSEDLCSLKPKKERMAFTVEMDFDETGQRVGQTFYTSLIKSNERMTYTKVKQIIIDKDPKLRERFRSLVGMFDLMGHLCLLLRQKRLERGSLDFDLPEPEILIDIDGNLDNIIRAERNFAHQLIEEFMISANEAVAEYFEAGKLPSLYRTHEEPDERKMEEIVSMCRHALSLKRHHVTSRDFPKIITRAHGTPYEDVINYLILRSLKQAKYSTSNVGHFGLASKCYTHFTSPIRRYPDLIVHRLLKESLNGTGRKEKEEKLLVKKLGDIAFHSSLRERVADEAERETINALRAWFMKDRVGETFTGKIIGIKANSLKVRLNDFFVDGYVYVTSISDDNYVYDEGSISLKGLHTGRQFFVGDPITVRVDKVDREEREIILGL